MNSRENLIKLLEEYPLYKSIEIGPDFADLSELKTINFNYECSETCKKDTTHVIGYFKSGFPFPSKQYDETPYPDHGVDPSSYRFSTVQEYYTKCNLCGRINGSITLRAHTDKEIADPNHKLYIQKIGQFPQFNSASNKRTTSILSKSSRELYKKATNLFGNSYGIGCMVYLRRIVEEELLLILKKILDQDAITELENQERKYQGIERRKVYEFAGSLIPETINKYGDNPILKIWDISSIAIHSQTDEEAMSKCGDVIKLLDFLIDRLDFEKSDSKTIKDILKG